MIIAELRYDDINEFEIMNYLGGGAFGKVYKIKHKKSEELYVLKEVMVNALNLKESHISQCLEEARFLMQNRHPHIIGTQELQLNVFYAFLHNTTIEIAVTESIMTNFRLQDTKGASLTIREALAKHRTIRRLF